MSNDLVKDDGFVYDSRPDTWEHINQVQKQLQHVMNLLHIRGLYHDQSKLQEPELTYFNIHTPKLKSMAYGSAEYKESLAALKPALDHHYSKNSHHPEFYENGIQGMSLLDVVEMFCDWSAATTRGLGGDIFRSIEVNQARFGYSDELKSILTNTAIVLTGRMPDK